MTPSARRKPRGTSTKLRASTARGNAEARNDGRRRPGASALLSLRGGGAKRLLGPEASALLEVSTSRRQLPDDPGRPSESRPSRSARALRGHGRHETGKPALAEAARRRLAKRKPSHPKQRLSRGEPCRAKVDPSRESGEERPRTRRDCPKAVPVRMKSTGMRDRAVCSRISSNAEAPRAGPRDPGKDLADPGLGLIVGRPSGSVVDGRSGSRRGRREREVILAWKRGSSSLFASCGRITSLHGGVASGKARPTTERLDAGNCEREAPCVTRDRQVPRSVERAGSLENPSP